MNFFSVLESDDEDETFTKVSTSKTSTNTKSGANKGNQTKSKAAPAPVVESAPSASEKPGSGRGGGRGNRGGRSGRGGKHEKGDAPPRKREFDRRSGTGRGKEVAKGGAGKANWGNPNKEAEQAVKEDIDVEATASGEEGAEAVGWVAEPEVEAEPEVPTYTLDEYLATRNSSRANAEIFGEVSVRKVEADFSGLRTKEEEEDTFIALGGAKSSQRNKKDKRSAKNAQVLDVGFSCGPSEQERNDRREARGGRGRGGRGEGRGGRGRGAPGPRKGGQESRVDINDASAFPSL